MTSPHHSRRSGRINVAIPVRVASGESGFTGMCANIGARGLFLVTDQVKPVGEELVLRFQLPPREKELSVRGQVRWVREDGASEDRQPLGMGLRFLSLSVYDEITVRHFVQSIEDRGNGDRQ